jgi:signal transduction histidine kinase
MLLWWWPDMSTKTSPRFASDLEVLYSAALQDYLRQRDEGCLHRGYELGRRAVGEGKSILEMIEVHQRASQPLVSRSDTSAQSAGVVEAATVFFKEVMSPYEMTNRAFGEANAALAHLNDTLEAEIKRLAHALHDDAGQLLAAVHIQLEDIGRTLPGHLRERLQEVRRVLDQIEDQLRGLSHELRSPVLEDQGLLLALQTLAGTVSRRTKLRVTVEGTESPRFPLKIEAVLYRVAQEALKNAAKHARAHAVKIRLWRLPGCAACSVEDDGMGFDYDAVSSGKIPRGLGLLGIRERLQVLGGNCEIQSAPAQGTKLNIRIPLEE